MNDRIDLYAWRRRHRLLASGRKWHTPLNDFDFASFIQPRGRTGGGKEAWRHCDHVVWHVEDQEKARGKRWRVLTVFFTQVIIWFIWIRTVVTGGQLNNTHCVLSYTIITILNFLSNHLEHSPYWFLNKNSEMYTEQQNGCWNIVILNRRVKTQPQEFYKSFWKYAV